jgi:hypothetical protein
VLSNETSTHLRAFPRRKAWYATFQYNYKRNRVTPFGTKRITITLWNLTKKYEGALKQKDIIPVKEAEVDREEVAEAYRVLETPWERNLDGRFYHTLATMQHRRDSHIAAPELAPQEWLLHFANEVKRRATPLLFVVNQESSVPSFALPHVDDPVTMAQAPTRDDRQAMKKHQVPFSDVSIESLDSIRKTLQERLRGKRFKYSELSDHLTNWELDLLSQMIRDNHIPALFDKTSVKFLSTPQNPSTNSAFAAVAIEAKNYQEVQRR